MKFVMLRIWISAFLLLAGGLVAGQTTLQQRLDELLEADFFNRASCGVFVYDLDADRPLYARNEHRLCRPASCMKLLTAATALQTLPRNFYFSTVLSALGSIDADSCLHGSLYIKGGFDPELSVGDLDSLAAWLRVAGIRRFEGMVHADMSRYNGRTWGNGWAWDDDPWGFQPYLTALPLNKGAVEIATSPTVSGKAPKIECLPATSFIKIVNTAQTVWKSEEPTDKTLHFTRSGNDSCNIIEISGTIAAKAKPYKESISVNSPTGYVLTVFAERLTAVLPGSIVTRGGEAVTPAEAIAVGEVRHDMRQVIVTMNKLSDNLNAEMLLCALASTKDDKPTATKEGEPSATELGIVRIMRYIKRLGFDPQQFGVVDGSGLSDYNLVSPALLVSVLRDMFRAGNYSLFFSSLPVAGVDGTLKNRLKGTPAYRRIFAKTGSLTGVTTLAGYATAANGHQLAFAVMIQNFTEKNREINRLYIDNICKAMVEIR